MVELALVSVAVIVGAGLLAVAAYLALGILLRLIGRGARQLGLRRRPASP